MTNTIDLRRLEFVGGGSNKFWEVYDIQQGNSHLAVRRWGKLGTRGQAQLDTWTPKLGQLYAEKVAKGYEVTNRRKFIYTGQLISTAGDSWKLVEAIESGRVEEVEAEAFTPREKATATTMVHDLAEEAWAAVYAVQRGDTDVLTKYHAIAAQHSAVRTQLSNLDVAIEALNAMIEHKLGVSA